jgi:hypothetical protein
LTEARRHGTRSGADLLNIRVEKGWLEVRRNFFTNRVIEKNARSMDTFKRMYCEMREDSWASPEMTNVERTDGNARIIRYRMLPP